MRLVKWIKGKIWNWKREREFKRKLAELKKRDPFTYKNF